MNTLPSAIMMQMLAGFTISRSIGVAAELGIADLVKNIHKSSDELAALTNTHPRSLYRLLRALASVGILSEDTGHCFGLTPLGECLRSDHPESLRAFAEMFTGDISFQMWAKLTHSIKTGQPAFDKVFGMPAFDYLFSHEKEGKIFNDAMNSLSFGSSIAVLGSYDFSGIKKLVDIGGGLGFLLAVILKKYSAMKGILFDIEPVLESAKALLQEHGVWDRCQIIGGDFFESVPAGGDAYILKNIIHDWNDEQCTAILNNCRKGIASGGKVLVVEMVVPEGSEPSISKLSDLQMMAILPGQERTENEYRNLFSKTGFGLTTIVPTASPYSVIEGVAI
jgi:hypothetical protein